LLYVPAHPAFDLWNRDAPRGLKLYVQRTFILDQAEQFLPMYLRFVRGVVDSNDLPLNVSREILQESKDVETIRKGCVNKVLGLLEDLAENHKDKYAAFWKDFGRVLKEGTGEDWSNKERIAKLLRFASTQADSDEQNVSLTDYVARLKEGQDKIYYITADSHAAAKNSPHLEIFRKKGIEVLLLSDRVDEWVASNLSEFEGKPLASVAKGDLDLGALADEEKKEQEKEAGEFKDLVEKIKTTLDAQVKDVRVTFRLTDSPACLVSDRNAMSANLERMLKAAGQPVPVSKPILEVNPHHPLVQRLKSEADESRFGDWSHILFDQALLAEGGQLEDPASFVKRLNELMLAMAK
jgi:molecular chaperone HtpG